MSLEQIHRRTTTEAPKNFHFYEKASTMQMVGKVLVVAIFLLAGLAVADYFYHVTPIKLPVNLLTIAIGGSVLVMGSFIVGVYLHKKSYWRDIDWVENHLKDYNFKDINNVKQILRRKDLPKLFETVIDKEGLKTILLDWIERNSINLNLVQEFHKEFGWKPFELGILEIERENQDLKALFSKSVDNMIQAKGTLSDFIGQQWLELVKYGFIDPNHQAPNQVA